MNRLVPEDYARLTRCSSPAVSAGGAAAWVQYFWQHGAWQRRVTLLSDGGAFPVSLGGTEERCPAFSGDGTQLWFLSDGRVAVHSLPLCRTRVAFSLPEGFEATDLLPLGDGCLCVCRRERRETPPAGCAWEMPRVAEALRFRSDADHGFARRYTWRLYRYDGTLRLAAESEAPFRCLAALPDESAVLFFRDGFRLLRLADGDERAIPSPLPAAGDLRPVISADGAYALAAVRAENAEVVLRRLWLDGQEHAPDEMVGAPAGLADGAYMDLSPERPTLLARAAAPDTFCAACFLNHTPGLWEISAQPGRLVWRQRAVSALVTEVGGETVRGAFVMVGDARFPPRPAWLAGDAPDFCGPDPNPWLADYDAVTYLSIAAPSQDGRAELRGWLLLPPSPSPRTPLLVWVHGGPAGCWAPGFNLELQSAVGEGFAVLLPNPRGSTGRGDAYASPAHAFDGGAANDILCLLDEALRSHPCLDPRQVSVLGGSYGGYMAAWLEGTTARFRSAVVIKAVTNWLFIHFNSSQAGQPIFDDYRDFQDFLVDTVKSSPVYLAQDVNIPTLIIHGEKDQQVPVENAHQYYTALKDCHPDLPVRLMLLPDACHRYSTDRLPDYLAIQRETLAWLNRYGKGETP